MKVRSLASVVCFCLTLMAEAVSYSPSQMTDTLKIAYSYPSDGMVEGQVTNEEGAP